jgi:hypothetical protein
MKMFGRRVFIGMILLSGLLFGCRDNPDYEEPSAVPDRIAGTTRDRFRNPIPGVKVRVYFDYVLQSYDPEPQRTITLFSDSSRVDVIVNDQAGLHVRTLFSGICPRGDFSVIWNGTDSSGSRMPSGVYVVRYVVQDTLSLEYLTLVDGGVVTRTDSIGSFRIDTVTLPFNFATVPIYSANGEHFSGNYRITRLIGILFETPYASVFKEISVFDGYGNIVDVIIE